MNLHLLRLFTAVAEAGSFSRAAQSLHISQPAISKGVKELESQLGLVLIERGRAAGGQRRSDAGMRLTEAGAALLGHAHSLFAIERIAMEDVRARVGVQRGSLVIGASTTIAGYLLPPYLAAFSQAHPEVTLQLTVGNTQRVCEQLAECRIDLALVEGEVQDERLHVAHWKDDALAIVVPPGSALTTRKATAAQLSGQRWILREPGSGTRQATEALCRANGIQADCAMELASNAAIARTILHGTGIAMLPHAVVADLLALGALRQVRFSGPRALSRPLFLLTLKSRPATPAVTKMLALLRAPRPGKSAA